MRSPDPLDSARPYPELDPQLEEAIRFMWTRGGRATAEELAFRANWDWELVSRASRRGLITADAHDYRLTALALLYLRGEEGEGVERILAALDMLFRSVHDAYMPGADALSGAELVEASGLPVDQLAELAPYARDLDLGLVNVQGEWRLNLQPSVARQPSLAALFAARYTRGHVQPAPMLPGEGSPLAAQLTTITCAGFRTLNEFELSLPSRLTVLVGPNGVGKSTVLDLVGFVARAARGGTVEALRSEGGFRRLRTRSHEGAVRVAVDFNADPGMGRRHGRYAFTLDRPYDEVLVEREALTFDDVNWLDGRRAVVRLRDTNGDVQQTYRGAGQLSLADLTDRDRHPVAANLRRDLASVLLVDRDPIIRSAPSLDARPTRERAPADVFKLMEGVAESAERTEALGRVLAELIPSVESVRRVALTGEAPYLEVIEAGVPGASRVDELSAGTRQMCLLAAVYVSDQRPRTLLLEEPDAGLHPGVLPVLRDLLRSLAAHCTIIATSHSPVFIGLLDPEHEVVALQRASHGVQARSLANALTDRAWLASFGGTAEAFVRRSLERER